MKKIMIRVLAALSCLVYLFLFQTQLTFAQEIPVSLSLRVEHADLIVEGKVVAKHSYWNAEQNRIFTANEVVLYKNFKSTINTEKITVITEGGIVGDRMEDVSHSLQLGMGDVGLFFLDQAPLKKINPQSKIKASLQFSPIAATQSLIQYNLQENIAIDFTQKFKHISKALYPEVTQLVGKGYKEVKKLPIIEHKPNNENKSFSSTPIIHCFSPNIISAGTNSVLTIEGENFGVQGSNSKVELYYEYSNGWFPNPVPSDYIVEWTDKRIQVVIPLKFGSGTIRVTNTTNANTTSTEELTINFSRSMTSSANNPIPAETMLIGDDGNGGYAFKYNTNTNNGGINFNTSSAKSPFERALTTAQEKYGSNFYMDGTTSINTAEDDGINVVTFDNDLNPLSPLGRTYTRSTKCNSNDIYWEAREIDIIFRQNLPNHPNGTAITWNYTTSIPNFFQYDFESVALHELSHAVQLNHINETDAVLYPTIANGQYKREALECYEILGANYVNNESQEFMPFCSGHSLYTLHPNFQGYPDYSSCPVASVCEPDCFNHTFAETHTSYAQSNLHYSAPVSISSQATIQDGSTVTYDAGQCVDLEDGFLADSGSDFIAQIEGCAIVNTSTKNDVEEAVSPLSTNIEQLSLQIAPNPSHDNVQITYAIAEDSPVSIEIYSVSGKLEKVIVDQSFHQIGKYNQKINVSDLNDGIYVIHIYTQNSQLSQKLIKL